MTLINDFPQKAVIVTLVNEMAKIEGWCGETHIQKTTYFLKRLLGVPLAYEFVMYKHGPYSFDLHDDLTGMRANRFLKTEPRYPYGPSFRQGDLGSVVTTKFPQSPQRFKNQIDFIAQELGGKRVMELERLATAMYITLDEGYVQSNVDDRAQRIRELKPHVSFESAQDAVQRVDDLRDRAKSQRLILAPYD